MRPLSVLAVLSLAAFSLTLAGCAPLGLSQFGFSHSGFSKPGATYQNFMTDRYQCIREATEPSKCVNERYFRVCMLERGWTEDSKGFMPKPGSLVKMC